MARRETEWEKDRKLARYQRWINKKYPANRPAMLMGRCYHATLDLCRSFPGELTQVGGWVELESQSGQTHRDHHYWCTVNSNPRLIIDPTAGQYHEYRIAVYVK